MLTHHTHTDMFLLIAGSTDTARALIVDEFLSQHSDWRHLALEDIVDSWDEGIDDHDVLGFQQSFMTMVACECAKEAYEAGHRIIITCPRSEMIEGVYHEIGAITSIYLGKPEEADGFDHIIDASSESMKDICAQLDQIVEATPA